MFGKRKNIVSVYLLLVFLLPSVVKFEHHHEHKFIKVTYDKQYDVLHEECPICSFEFSAFLFAIKKVEIQKVNPSDSYFNNYKSVYHSSLLHSIFLLRSPPAVKI
jgi:hypothetical protein